MSSLKKVVLRKMNAQWECLTAVDIIMCSLTL
jgi:hypothetical protein